MKYLKISITAFLTTALLGCHVADWHCASPPYEQLVVPAWQQVHLGMTRQEVHALMGKSLRQTSEQAVWTGPQIKIGFPSNSPPTTYWREYTAYFDANGRVTNLRDQSMADHQ